MAVAQTMTGPQAAMLGRRLHLQHGPIDLIIEAWGDAAEVRAGYRQARDAFAPVLQALVDELPVLRQAVPLNVLSSPRKRGSCLTYDKASANGTDASLRGHDSPLVSGSVANRMLDSVTAHEGFITPMAAVAGSVADHILHAMCAGRNLRKAMVNNGGDIALRLGRDETATIGVGDMRESGVNLRPMTVRAADGIGGIATSGWRGRSHSLGIADFVTAFATSAAAADAAATMIANAVDVPGSAQVTRERADVLSPDSDLGARLVTVAVAPLPKGDVQTALARGAAKADYLRVRGVIIGAVLGLQDQMITSTATAEKISPELETAS